MFIYLVLLGSLIVGAFLDLSKIKWKNIFFLFNFIFFFLVVTLRYGIGTDYEQYENLFYNAKSLFDVNYSYFLDQESNIEIGYLLFESVLKIFTDSFSVFILVYNLVLFLFLFLGIRNTKYYNIQLFLFFTLMHIYYISGHRQAMAMVIFLYSIHSLINQRTIKYFIFVFFASLFHSSSVFFILYYFVARIKLSKNIVFFIILSSFFIIRYDVLGFFIDYTYLNFKEISYVFARVHYYYFNQYGGEEVNVLNYIKVAMLAIVGLYFYDRVNYRLSYLLFLYFCSFYWLSYAGGIAFRIADCFLIGFLYYISQLFVVLNKNERLVFLGFLIGYGCLTFLRILYVHVVFNVNTFLPYKTILE